MKLASLSFSHEKKKDDFLIPATYFRNRDFEKTNNYSIVEETGDDEVAPPIETTMEPKEGAEQPKAVPKSIELKNLPKRVSGLSLSSLKAKKEHEAIKNPQVSEEDLPIKPFTEEDMQKHWNAYIQKIEKQGKKILASSLHSDVPRLKNSTTIWLEFPNSTMKKEVEREQGPLLDYLKEKLQNYSIEIQISVNEESAKKYAFTPEEKYQKLKEKNPAIEFLRKEFDLDF